MQYKAKESFAMQNGDPISTLHKEIDELKTQMQWLGKQINQRR